MTKNLTGKLAELLSGERVVVLDIETTGLSPDFDRIIEVGVLEFVDCKLVKQYSKMFGGGTSPDFLVSNIHGITDESRKDKETFEDCAIKVANYLSNAILVGHNIKRFDLPMLQAKLKLLDCKIDNVRVVDTCLLARRLKLGSNSLESLCQKFGIKHGGHRGLGDSLSSLELLEKLVELLGVEELNNLFN